MRVECTDDSFKPADIPNSFWVKRGLIYTVIDVLLDMNGVEYYKLEEVPLEQARTTYKGFSSSRFKILDSADSLEEKRAEHGVYS